MALPNFNALTCIYTALIVIVLRVASLIVYRLCFHPLSRFPGPSLAAITSWYQAYWDVWHDGQYQFKLLDLHQRYGPILRINPNEIHIKDAAFYDQIFCSSAAGRRVDIWRPTAEPIGADGSIITTTSHEQHRVRRAPLNPFFAKAAVARIRPWVTKRAERLIERIKEQEGPVSLNHAFSAMTGDIIAKYSFDEDSNLLEDPNFSSHWYDIFMGAMGLYHKRQAFPWYSAVLNIIPPSMIVMLEPDFARMLDFTNMLSTKIEAIKAQGDDEIASSDGDFPTILHALVNGRLPASEKATERLVGEASIVMGAGTTTTAHALTCITVHILSNETMQRRLEEELSHVMSITEGKPRMEDLAKEPYVNAVIKEGLRLSIGVMTRRQRVNPDGPIVYGEWVIPKGTPVSMSNYDQLRDDKAFPSPHEFKSERWLRCDEDSEERLDAQLQLMEQAFTPFSRGTRNCLGMNLAYLELYAVVGALFRPGAFGKGRRLALYETSVKHVGPCADMFVPKHAGSEPKIVVS